MKTFLPMIASLLAAQLTGVPVGAEAAVMPPSFSVKALVHAGSSCPASTAVFAKANSTNGSVIVAMPKIQASSGPSLRNRRAICQVSLDVESPAGWEYSVLGVTTHSDSRLVGGDKATVRVQTWLQGSTLDLLHAQLSWKGPVFHANEPITINSAELHWSGCDNTHRPLNLAVETRVEEAPRDSSLTSLSAPVILNLEWRRCTTAQR